HDVVLRRTLFELRNAEDRLHILEGFKIALDNLDEVIATIRASQTPPEASEQLQAKFGLSEVQAKAILEMRLQRLTGLEREKIEEEYRELLKVISRLRDLVENKDLRMQLIKGETQEIRDKFGDARRSRILENYSGMLNPEDMVADELVVVTITHDGYVKRLPVDTYRVQGRGGRGLTGTNLKDEDNIQYIFVASTHSYILLFTDHGRCYWLKVYEIPEASRTARGKAVVNLVKFEDKEKIRAFVTLKNFSPEQNVVMCTKNGTVKKSALAAFSRPRSSGILAIRLMPGDELIDARITEGNDDIILATKNGYCNRFNEKDFRQTARFTKGVRGIRLRDEDYVISMGIISQEDIIENGNPSGKTILAISENGYGKRTLTSAYPTTRRGSKGVITLKTSQRNGHLAALMIVDDSEDLMIITQDGKIIRQKISEIKSISRNTQGVRLINLYDNDKVCDITLIPPDLDDEELDVEVEKLKNAPPLPSAPADDEPADDEEEEMDDDNDEVDVDIEEDTE
ncbi:MAG TPA: DNA gyrase C-terminal beta-propeller domain-containing protein, partial [Candidatus Syntrophosphaera sp.]|nr:DNA gyrase C-terminal beta-propeller domain-containing protein [Candidatus Syntrophosphaera sp.]